MHILFVLFGAPLSIASTKTALLSSHISALTFVPMSCVVGFRGEAWSRLLSRGVPLSHGELVAYIPAAGALIGVWVGAFPIPLDWDRPWQAWPITCAVGGTVGHGVGLLAACIAIAAMSIGGKESGGGKLKTD